MKLFIDAQHKEEIHGEVIGSSMKLEEMLAKSYQRISSLEERLSTLKMDSEKILLKSDSTGRRDLQKSEPKQNASNEGEYSCVLCLMMNSKRREVLNG